MPNALPTQAGWAVLGNHPVAYKAWFNVAKSITKRYFTSPFSMRS